LVSDDFNIKPWFKSTGELDPPKGYATDLLTDDAVSFIKSTTKKQPFFLWLTYNAPHYGQAIIEGKKELANNKENTCWIEPKGGSLHKGRISGKEIRLRNTLAAKPEDVELFKDTKDRKRRFYQAMVKSMDDGIGQVLKTLKETGHDKNTIVIFYSDQGSDETISSAGNNRPFRGAKHTQWEGGVRVPFVIQWPGHIKPGSVVEQIGSHTDLLPTFC
jgi:arylsulfatase A-like enzyme